jgi:hypothetical protein
MFRNLSVSFFCLLTPVSFCGVKRIFQLSCASYHWAELQRKELENHNRMARVCAFRKALRHKDRVLLTHATVASVNDNGLTMSVLRSRTALPQPDGDAMAIDPNDYGNGSAGRRP